MSRNRGFFSQGPQAGAHMHVDRPVLGTNGIGDLPRPVRLAKECRWPECSNAGRGPLTPFCNFHWFQLPKPLRREIVNGEKNRKYYPAIYTKALMDLDEWMVKHASPTPICVSCAAQKQLAVIKIFEGTIPVCVRCLMAALEPFRQRAVDAQTVTNETTEQELQQ